MARIISLFGLAALLSVAGCGKEKAVGEYGPEGLALGAVDKEVRPGDDFYRYVNGKWLDTFEIPADRSRYGVFTELHERSEKQVRAIVEEVAASQPSPGSQEAKIADYYNAFLDVENMNARGVRPLIPYLARIITVNDMNDLADLFASGVYKSPVAGWVDVDAKQPDRHIYYFTQSGLGLPDRSYYLDDGDFFVDIRNKYLEFLETMLAFAGHRAPREASLKVLALETDMAKLHWEPARRRERDLTYNLHSREELIALGGGFPIARFIDSIGLSEESSFVVRETDAIAKLFALAASNDLEVWRDYLTIHLLADNAPVLGEAVDKAHFAFFGKALGGRTEQRERWKRGISGIESALGEAVGRIYVQRHFPPDSKAKMQELVANLRAAFENRIDALEWMGDETRTEAQDKLGKFIAKIGYPEEFESYADLTVQAGEPLKNLMAVRAWALKDMLSKLGAPVDRDEWFMTPQTVNAYYAPNRNEIVFPAAILQIPFFGPDMDPAVNYGGIGAVIGHEMGHGFDDQGSKSDGDGRLRNWWSDEDRAAFTERTKNLVALYEKYSPLDGAFVNGQLTLGENIGDLGGLSISYLAYRLSLGGQEAPVIKGLTGDQRFFMSWAQVWRALYRDEALHRQLKTDPHSPPQYRVNGVVRNIDAWYDAFQVTEDDAMYLAPSKRVKIW